MEGISSSPYSNVLKFQHMFYNMYEEQNFYPDLQTWFQNKRGNMILQTW